MPGAPSKGQTAPGGRVRGSQGWLLVFGAMPASPFMAWEAEPVIPEGQLTPFSVPRP